MTSSGGNRGDHFFGCGKHTSWRRVLGTILGRYSMVKSFLAKPGLTKPVLLYQYTLGWPFWKCRYTVSGAPTDIFSIRLFGSCKAQNQRWRHFIQCRKRLSKKLRANPSLQASLTFGCFLHQVPGRLADNFRLSLVVDAQTKLLKTSI